MLVIKGPPVSHVERMVSTTGGFIRILFVLLVSSRFLGPQESTLIVASMGASAALVAVVGGPGIHELGYGYVIAPVLLNVVVILTVAVVFNYPWHWRRYPAALKPPREQVAEEEISAETAESISHAGLVYAFRQIDSFIDVNEHDLLRIYDLATHRLETRHLQPESIGLGRYYSNGKYGDDWQIRRVVDASPHDDPEQDRGGSRPAVLCGLHAVGFRPLGQTRGRAQRELMATSRDRR